jgi:hypothetical protein
MGHCRLLVADGRLGTGNWRFRTGDWRWLVADGQLKKCCWIFSPPISPPPRVTGEAAIRNAKPEVKPLTLSNQQERPRVVTDRRGRDASTFQLIRASVLDSSCFMPPIMRAGCQETRKCSRLAGRSSPRPAGLFQSDGPEPAPRRDPRGREANAGRRACCPCQEDRATEREGHQRRDCGGGKVSETSVNRGLVPTRSGLRRAKTGPLCGQ